MIVYNTDFVLQQVLDSIRPYGNITIVEGPVKYWQEHQITPDDTNKIIDKPMWRTRVKHGQWEEKTEMCQAFTIPDDTDFLWCIDGDEVFKPETIEKVIDILRTKRPASLGFKSRTFYGGFDRVMTGFEARHNFKRVLKYTPGCKYVNHRPPTLEPEEGEHIKLVDEMYHYSYVSPRQVKEKIQYYENAVIKPGDCKENYFDEVFMAWQKDPAKVEFENKGVHEFKSVMSFTEPFTGEHPQVIIDTMSELKAKFNNQLNEFKV